MTDASTSQTPPIRVLIADGQVERSDALTVVLSREADIDVIADVARGDELVDAARDAAPDVAIIDIELPGLDGISAAAQLRYEMPNCQVIIIATRESSDSLERALQAGASGFIITDTPATPIADAVRRVHQGMKVVDDALAAESLAQLASPLTELETDVLSVARAGGSNSDLARILHLSEPTLRNHLSHAIVKLGGRNRADAARIAEENGWL